MARFEVLRQGVNSKYPYARVGRYIKGDILFDTPRMVYCASKGNINSCSITQMTSNSFVINSLHMHMIQQEVGMVLQHNLNHHLLFTDSGGFQILSFRDKGVFVDSKKDFSSMRDSKSVALECPRVCVRKHDVFFKNIYSGQRMLFGNEQLSHSHKIYQYDICFLLDHYPEKYDLDSLEYSLSITDKWQKNFLAQYGKDRKSMLFAINHGGTSYDLRLKSFRQILSMDIDGIAIGGFLGSNPQEMRKNVVWILHLAHDCLQQFNKPNLPIHVLGVGKNVEELEMLMLNGADTFDCVYPTRAARHGVVYGFQYPGQSAKISKTNAHLYRKLDEDCSCTACTYYTFSDIYVLHRIKDLLYYSLTTEHNILFFNRLANNIRSKI